LVVVISGIENVGILIAEARSMKASPQLSTCNMFKQER